MGSILPNPFIQFMGSDGAAYSGGVLRFYISGTSTPFAVYSDRLLTTPIGTSLTLNSAGRPSTLVFLQPSQYKITLEDSNGVVIWTADPVNGSDFAIFPKWTSGSGSPNGVVAGTAGSSGILPDVYFDYTNNILYICTTTGSISTAVWTALNAAAATPSVPPPQGRLTPTSATPILAADVISATSVFYTPYNGNLIPIYNGSSFTPTTFSELTLTLASQHAASTLYDVFVFSNSGVLTLVTGPAWNTSTAGSGARGSGASTTQLSRVNGFWTNAVQITGRNGATTYAIGANLATYLGSIFIDATPGQVTCHASWGQSRKFGVWNAYNRAPIILLCGDSTASWAYNTSTIRQSNAAAANTLAIFCGLPEEYVSASFTQAVGETTGTGDNPAIYIGINSTTSPSGTRGNAHAGGGGGQKLSVRAVHDVVPFVGVNNVNPLENGASTGGTFYGVQGSMVLRAEWRG